MRGEKGRKKSRRGFSSRRERARERKGSSEVGKGEGGVKEETREKASKGARERRKKGKKGGWERKERTEVERERDRAGGLFFSWVP